MQARTLAATTSLLLLVLTHGMARPRISLASEPQTLVVQGKAVRVPAPEGMSAAGDFAGAIMSMLSLGSWADGITVDKAVMFVTDTVLSALRAGRVPAGTFLHFAVVVPWPYDEPSRDGARKVIQWERNKGESFLMNNDTDSLVAMRARQRVKDDPEGTADFPLNIPAGQRVGLAVMDFGPEACGQVKVVTTAVATADSHVCVALMTATSAVVTGERGVWAMMSRNAVPTTGAVADVRRRFSKWVRDIIQGNASESPGAVPPLATDLEFGPGKSDESWPKPDEYVYVEEIPTALLKVSPKYPKHARTTGIDGTVLVQALVGKDGRVLDTMIKESIPELDESALLAVRKWRFKPAQSGGKPVLVWVVIPVKFTLR
jgi:TonB family protein